MSWEAMVADEEATRQILTDHHVELASLETRERQRNGATYSSAMWTRGFRQAVEAVIPWLLWKQRRMDELTAQELIAELRKGPGSVYWPVKEADPQFWAVCDRCRTSQLFTASGVCPCCGDDLMENCGYDIVDGALTQGDN